MNPKILKFAQLLARRPKDRTIALLRITVGLLLVAVGFLGGQWYSIDFPGINSSNEIYFEYAIGVLGLLPLFGGLTRLCLFKHKTVKKLQMLAGVIMILVGFPIMDPVVTDTNLATVEESIELGAEVPEQDTPHNPGWIIGLLGFLPLFMGITGK